LKMSKRKRDSMELERSESRSVKRSAVRQESEVALGKAEMLPKTQERWNSVKEGFEKISVTIKAAKLTPGGKMEKVTPLNAEEWMRVSTDLYHAFYDNSFVNRISMYRAIREYFTEVVLTFCERVNGANALSEYTRCWESVQMMATYVSRLSAYAHRNWIARLNIRNGLDPVLPIESIMLLTLKQRFRSDLPHIVESALVLVDENRKGKPVDFFLVRTVVQSLVMLGQFDAVESKGAQSRQSQNRLGLYVRLFESKFLQRTREFYHGEAKNLRCDCTVAEFMRKVFARLEEETQRSKSILHESSMIKLREAVDSELIGSQWTFIYNDIDSMIREYRYEDLKLVYVLSERIESGVASIKSILQKFVAEEGLRVTAQCTEELSNCPADETAIGHKLIQKLLDIYSLRSKMVMECFASSELLMKALEKSFAMVMNKQGFGKSSMAETLARYVDRLMSTDKEKDDQILYCSLSAAMKLFAIINDKDLFVEAYRRHLSVRLLLGTRRVDEQFEAMLIENLKESGGAVYAINLAGMFKDMQISKDSTASFRQWCAEQSSEPLSGIDTSVKVLKSLYWPLSMRTQIKPHVSLRKCMSAFEMCYKERTEGRKIEWMHAYSFVTLYAHFDHAYDVTCNTIQATVLLLFNDKDEHKVGEIAKELGVDVGQIVPHLRVIPMLKSSGSDGTVWMLNKDFQSKRRRLRLHDVAEKVAKKEGSERLKSRVSEDRSHLIDSVIVQVMKSQRKQQHHYLMSAVIERLRSRFKPEVSLIKQRIDRLIGQDYIQRDEADDNTYIYVQ